ncbi:2OG-Fe(II) oxygenase [Hyphobacterium sp.]|uniref:2OG-Fe(II) oxygenase n=1 Tax=Hyphobacterium sp. TaxID=2004662 RepID=UPI003B52DADA
MAERYARGHPFPHIVIDDFLPETHARFLADKFPGPESQVWLDYRKRPLHQYGKLGPGGSSRFDHLDPEFRMALAEFNNSNFLAFLEALTGIPKLIPDPYFKGGGIHQIVAGGILDVHTDFNHYEQLDLYRRLNVLIYLTEDWQEGFGGELELWDRAPSEQGKPVKLIPPVFNRFVVFGTNKTTFHGHPNPWRGPDGLCRRSIALYYYTAQPELGVIYDKKTDFQGVAKHEVKAD